MRVVIAGAGAIGVTIAYYLSLRGAEVSLYDPAGVGSGSSFGNAGLLVPSYARPLASPENLREALRSLVGRTSGTGVRAGWCARNANWIMRYAAASLAPCFRRRFELLARLSRRSAELYADLLQDAPENVCYAARGVGYVYRTEISFERGRRAAAELQSFGVTTTALSRERALEHEPSLRADVAGMIWSPGDAQLHPYRYVAHVAALAQRNGVRTVQREVDADALEGDRVIIAGGCDSVAIAARFGLRVPIAPAKGYSIDVSMRTGPRIPLVFQEDHVTITPFGANAARLTTGLDFHGWDRSIPLERLRALRTAPQSYLDGPEFGTNDAPWAGFRPLTPDGLPIIGTAARAPRILFATGHGALGITLAPATAELVTEHLLDGRAIEAPFSPGRFGI